MLVHWNLDAMGPETQRVLDGTIQPYGLIAANHNGRRGVLLKDTPVRVVCANTLGASEGMGGGVTVRHTKGGTERIKQAAAALWGETCARYERIAGQYERLQKVTLSPEQFQKVVCQTVSPITRLRPESPMAKVVLERIEGQWNSLTRLWHEGSGQTDDHSGWEAYNAVTEALDHDPDHVFQTRGPRVSQLLDGHLADKKNLVLTRLLSLTA